MTQSIPPEGPHSPSGTSPSADDDATLVTVAERPTEPAAAVLVNILADVGIRAVAVGGFTAGFAAEAPGWVQVKTFERDAAKAREIIAQIKSEPLESDSFDSE
ncbi:hypothetical protein RISK_006139 [Rhodopirellula islandica]|uniref:DUF2007 domain-containing protein n=1 Tax=Rhodopirellula islandica TaxID=595434 RepID=A0A0J1B571_RHOIS|nr:hypothetical protein [Rhodopirellula islandica]KLU01955.1 hypothetical protein RISK_006139 [Rhodopirellula islandica]